VTTPDSDDQIVKSHENSGAYVHTVVDAIGAAIGDIIVIVSVNYRICTQYRNKSNTLASRVTRYIPAAAFGVASRQIATKTRSRFFFDVYQEAEGWPS
jgi:hypothetical protein